MCDPAVPVVAKHYLGRRCREFFYNAVVDRICIGAENDGEPVSLTIRRQRRLRGLDDPLQHRHAVDERELLRRAEATRRAGGKHEAGEAGWGQLPPTAWAGDAVAVAATRGTSSSTQAWVSRRAGQGMA